MPTKRWMRYGAWSFFRKGGQMRAVVKGKRWVLLTRWVNLSGHKKQLLNELFRMNRKVMKAYLLKESLDRLWLYNLPGRYTAVLTSLDGSNSLGSACRRLKSWHGCSGITWMGF
jgi:hypothetical protein